MFVELGPGRGTLAKDALRVMRGAGFEGEVHLVETSPRLRQEQANRVPDAQWHGQLQDLPARPLLLVANEFLDALPMRQWIGHEERMIAFQGDSLVFTADGPVSEDSPAREQAVEGISDRLRQDGGAALIIDYGHARAATGNTLQAVRGHAFVDVLAEPGEQDLTSHVDFEALAKAAAGVRSSAVIAQGHWLERLGISARTAALATAHPERSDEIEAARQRLCASDQMGELFKVMALHSNRWPAPAGFGQ
jgi:SAM-dependent MidA family methyltransferase